MTCVTQGPAAPHPGRPPRQPRPIPLPRQRAAPHNRAPMGRAGCVSLALLLALAGCSSTPPPSAPAAKSSSGAAPAPALNSINRPVTVPASRATLPDGEEVLGVVAGGQARAYRLSAFKTIAYHVVNDVVGQRAVTVTYCDRTDCVRGFTDNRESPLPIGVGGFRDGLLLLVGDRYHRQDDEAALMGDKGVPYQAMPLARTTWGEWKKAHPDTDVYLGGAPPPGSPPLPESNW